jgi:hypothetical protein
MVRGPLPIAFQFPDDPDPTHECCTDCCELTPPTHVEPVESAAADLSLSLWTGNERVFCRRCGRELHHPDSRRDRIGPRCAVYEADERRLFGSLY